MGDSAVGKERRVRDVERPTDYIDVRQGGAGGGGEAHAPDGRSLLSPCSERESNHGV